MASELEDRLKIRELVENWVVWRDAGFWDRFRTVWHDDSTWDAESPCVEGHALSHIAGAPGVDSSGQDVRIG